MEFEKMEACADMVLSAAIDDLSLEKGITTLEARSEIVESGAYDALYDFETGLWMEGSDYFLEFVKKMQNRKN